jgi:solute carrier family 45 protein 1/2/4
MQAQSWATRLSGLGQIFGSLAGLSYVPGGDSLGEITTFRIIAVASIFAVDITVAITCMGVGETTVDPAQHQTVTSFSVFAVIRKLLIAFRRTSYSIRSVFFIRFVSWVGWFSFLFYNTRCV